MNEELILFQMSINHDIVGLCNSASKVTCSEDMPVKSVSRNLSWMLKPKSEIILKKKAAKYITDRSAQITQFRIM